MHSTFFSLPEVEPPSPVESLVRRDDQVELQEVVGVGEVGGASLGELQLVDVFSDAELSGRSLENNQFSGFLKPNRVTIS